MKKTVPILGVWDLARLAGGLIWFSYILSLKGTI